MCQYVGEHYAGDAACGVEEVGHEVASECGSAGGAQRCEPGGDIGLGEAVQHGVEHHRDGNDVEYKPEFWEFGSKIHEYFFSAIKMGEYGNFLSLKEGRDYNLVKKGTGRSTSYDGSCLSVQQSPIFTDPEKLKKLLEELPKMEYSQLVEFVSPDEMKAALEEMFNGSTAEENTTVSAPANDPLDPFSQSASVNPTPTTTAEEENDIDSLLNMI